MSDIDFDRAFEPRHGEAVQVAPIVRRVTAPNSGPFTFHGTNSYLVGRGRLALIDPGPDDDRHIGALMAALGDGSLTHIFVTHTHRDHTDALRKLQAKTGAITVSAGSHRFARTLAAGESNPLDAAADITFRPDVSLADGGTVEGGEWRLRGIATPGHTGNHMAFVLDGADLLFSGDHVMAWSTTIVAPPDGSMADYMASLDKLLARPEQRYLPGHGGPVIDATGYVRALKSHRRMREAAILDRLAKGDATIPEMVRAIYRDTDPRLHGAAALSVLAHLEDLAARGRIVGDGPPSLGTRYALA